MRGSNGVSLPRHASTDSAPATNAAASARSAANRPASASAVDTCVPLSSARPSFGPSVTGCRPAARERVARRHDAAVDPRLAFADQHRRKMRERREIAGRADRSLRRNARHDAGVGERDERLDHAPAHARVAARERRRLERDDEAHDGIVEQRPGARRMRQHERALQLREPRVVDARAGEQAESGVDAVDGPPGRDDAVDGLRGGIDRRLRRGVDGERHRLRPEPAQVGERRGGRERGEGSCIGASSRDANGIVPQRRAPRRHSRRTRSRALIIGRCPPSVNSAAAPLAGPHADDAAVPPRQGGASGQARLLPDGRLLRALLRRRAARGAAARHHADRARAIGGRADPDGRRAVPRGRAATSRS